MVNIENMEDVSNLYEITPVMGAFEVCYEGQVLFSKLKSNCWPNWNLVAGKCKKFWELKNQGKDTK